ncbi:hypothetical protein GPECTOR_522g508 [Gonium pectorale]|uniref:Ankyrin repeat domain-containing protein n=1 Tax=Gonium pectorale TaxID=33097 RepID=A0A150FWF1_GONPE|nr:hypothetical protein GPECTOR_522g508 [Gonium pectorale]|eukprot:KXZ41360.1 hypothetical protein GPECTOR_522g508 [Gonium pectorale]
MSTSIGDHAATTAARTWIPSIIDRIARFLPRNEVSCSLRVIDKATATFLQTPEFTTVRLSEPVPHHAFAWRWGRPGAIRDMTRAQREKLLCLTAASGATANLALAARVAGCRPTPEVGYAAGEAGQPGSCALLAELGCDMGLAGQGAAAGGHLALCEELMSRRVFAEDMYRAAELSACGQHAAAAGHTRILDWVRKRNKRQCRPLGTVYAWLLIRAIAKGCDLAALQRYHAKLIGPNGAEEEGREAWLGNLQVGVVAAAAGSPTPDWRAKLEWLESHAFLPTCQAFAAAAKLPDALERLTWLAQRGYPRRPGDERSKENAPLVAAAAAGNKAAVLYLAEGLPADEDFGDVWSAAAAKGHLPVLQALHAAGRLGHVRDTARAAARYGHLHVLRWLVEEALGLDAVPLDEELFAAAAASGSVELMAWLRERGCPWDARAFTAGAASGCVAALEWLAERGCPMPDDESPIVDAVKAEDFVVLECLQRLGCPWGPTGHVFDVCFEVEDRDQVPMLSWLLAAGCPIDWPTAVKKTTAALDDEMIGTPAQYQASVVRKRQKDHAWVCAEALRHQR